MIMSVSMCSPSELRMDVRLDTSQRGAHVCVWAVEHQPGTMMDLLLSGISSPACMCNTLCQCVWILETVRECARKKWRETEAKVDIKIPGRQYFIKVNMKSKLSLSIFLMHVPGLILNNLSVHVLPKKNKNVCMYNISFKCNMLSLWNNFYFLLTSLWLYRRILDNVSQ